MTVGQICFASSIAGSLILCFTIVLIHQYRDRKRLERESIKRKQQRSDLINSPRVRRHKCLNCGGVVLSTWVFDPIMQDRCLVYSCIDCAEIGERHYSKEDNQHYNSRL